MRFVLALCVVAACTLCGNAMSGASRRRVKLLEGLIGGMKLLKLHMISMFEPVRQALMASGCDLFEAVGKRMAPGISAAQAWEEVSKTAIRKGGMLDALDPDDLRALDRVFEQLGESGRDQQELLISSACSTLESRLETARRHTRETDRLYVSLGALTGLMIALILI